MPPQRESSIETRQQREQAILKADYEQSVKDVAEIIRLAQELEQELEKNQEYVVDLRSIRKAERVEKLAKNVKNRMKRFF
jgi:hypothetical protein